MAFLLIKRKVYLTKMNNLPKHHGAGPIQLHRLHRLKADPDYAHLL